MHLRTLLPLAVALMSTTAFSQDKKPEKHGLGYNDTPLIPGTKWHVHDGDRPQPPVITPGKKPGDAPSDAVVLFDGKDLDQWTSGKRDGSASEPAKWIVKDGAFECVPKSGYLFTKQTFGPDMQLHIEFATPSPGEGESQGRGNSGVFFHGSTYEIQVLDCYENKTYPDGQTSALYGQWPPLVNACRPAGEWQTYDIVFTSPRWKDGQLVSPAYVTIFHNGVLTQPHRALFGGTTHRKINEYKEHPEKGALALQDHGNPVRYRNVWIRELKPLAE